MITKKADFTGIKGNDGIFTLTEEYAAECGLSDKDSLHLRLLVEEILEYFYWPSFFQIPILKARYLLLFRRPFH